LDPIKHPTDREAIEEILEVGRRMYGRQYVASNDGNISVRVGENALWTTPTGVSKGFMTKDMLVKTDLNGHVLFGSRQPSSELKMHLSAYRENAEIRAVVHAHPPYATTFAAAGISLDKALLQEAVVQLGCVPVAQYALPGTAEVGESIRPFCKTYNGALLAFHGAVSWGENLSQAWHRMESIEYYAQVTLYTNMLGKERLLNENQVDQLIALRPKAGVKSGGRPKT
jgi:L-fuculose-phosphate aldolase